MPADNFTLELEGNADLKLIAVYKIECVLVDVTAYGARASVSDGFGNTEILTIDHTAGITVGTTDGEFTLIFTQASILTARSNLLSKEGKLTWQLVIWPTAAAETTNPVRLLEGESTYSDNIVDLV